MELLQLNGTVYQEGQKSCSLSKQLVKPWSAFMYSCAEVRRHLVAGGILNLVASHTYTTADIIMAFYV
jgi:hypothetical protein